MDHRRPFVFSTRTGSLYMHTTVVDKQARLILSTGGLQEFILGREKIRIVHLLFSSEGVF